MTAGRLRVAERRALDTRPRNGDVKPCPTCWRRSEFNERYRIDGHVVPAWVCDTPKCRQLIVRATRSSAAAASQAKAVEDADPILAPTTLDQ